MPLPFSSLRGNLIAAFALVIGVSVLLMGGAYGILMRDFQVEREKDRLGQVARGVAVQLGQAQRSGEAPAEIADQIDQVASAAGVRILLVNEQNVIVHDTEDDRFNGRTLPLPTVRSRLGGFQGVIQSPAGDQVFAVVPFAPLAGPNRVALIAPEQALSGAWTVLLPRITFASLGALLVSIAVAWWLASNISRPLRQITHASEEMARGNYDQQLSLGNSEDELGRLARAFNTMAVEVARSHRAMRDLLANVSHDLRTPLTSIQGFAGALVDGTLRGQEGAAEAGRVIGEEAERMRRLVEDLLYLGRIEAGDIALVREPMDLAELAAACGRRFTFRAEEAGVTLQVDATEPVFIAGDGHRLAQVLDNLLENAFRHTPRSGEIAIRVAASPAGVGGGLVSRNGRRERTALVTVHNTGSVIEPDELERVFERFYQVDKARAGGKGRGLGLAIAREIVQAHGGTLTVESSHNAGTAFTAALPLLEQSQSPHLSSRGAVRQEALSLGASPRRN